MSLLGTGGVAEVWRTHDHRLRRHVAVKLLSGPAARDPSHRRLIAREARALAAISHPNVVGVYDYGERPVEGGEPVPYIVMELVEGPDLARHLEATGPLPTSEAMRLLDEILTGLDQAHRLGIVHGDLKPANIFLAAPGAKVGDFGVARILAEETGTTAVVATPRYAAPEVLRGERPTPASDVYSAACIAFWLFCGRPPFEGSSVWELTRAHLEEEPPRIEELRPGLPAPIPDTLHRALSKDPQHRPAQARELASLLSGTISAPLPAAAEAATPADANSAATVPLRREPTEVLPPRPPRSGWNVLRHIPVGVLIAFLAVLALAGMREGETATVRVPVLTGMSEDDAADRAASAGFEISSIEIDAGGVAGTVVDQQPRPGSLLARGSVIELDVTAGSPQVEVPDVRGLVVDEARSAITDAGLSVGDVTYQDGAPAEPGRVAGTSPAVGERVDEGSEVEIVAAPPVPEEPRQREDGPSERRGEGNGPPDVPPGQRDR